MKEVKILVLFSGEQIICNCEFNDMEIPHYDVENPRVIIPQQVADGKVGISLDPWIRFAKQDRVQIAESAVVVATDPIESVRKAYIQQTTVIAVPPPGLKVL